MSRFALGILMSHLLPALLNEVLPPCNGTSCSCGRERGFGMANIAAAVCWTIFVVVILAVYS